MNRIYATCFDGTNDTLLVIDGKTNTVIAKKTMGKSSQGIAVNSTTSQVYITNDKDSTVSVFDGSTNTFSTTVPLVAKGSPCSVAVNPQTQQVFVTNLYAHTVSILDGNAFLTASEREYASRHGTKSGSLPPPVEEHFSTGSLDLTRWGVVQSQANPGATIDIVGTTKADRRLHMRLDKDLHPQYLLHGICTKEPVINFEQPNPTEIDVDVDWSQVLDGRALAAGIEICPAYTETDPNASPDYLQVMYHGDQANQATAHIEIRGSFFFKKYNFFDEGCEAANDTATAEVFVGRKIGLQHLRIIISENGVTVWENNKLICEHSFKDIGRTPGPLPWSTGYLYLVQSGWNDKPARDVYFSNISVHQLSEQSAPHLNGDMQPN
jgi:YVTN family beta-propeller protein